VAITLAGPKARGTAGLHPDRGTGSPPAQFVAPSREDTSGPEFLPIGQWILRRRAMQAGPEAWLGMPGLGPMPWWRFNISTVEFRKQALSRRHSSDPDGDWFGATLSSNLGNLTESVLIAAPPRIPLASVPSRNLKSIRSAGLRFD